MADVRNLHLVYGALLPEGNVVKVLVCGDRTLMGARLVRARPYAAPIDLGWEVCVL
jgi:hypothetical protein